jgi:NADH-quinone oxidoreductase subunit J
MGFEKIIFYIFALIAIGSATMVITVRNPVKSALYLVLTFFSVAAVWLILEAEFLAIVLVLVYVGAVMVLFLFVVMMLDINLARLKEGFIKYLPIGIGVAITFAVMLFTVVGSENFGLDKVPAPQAKGADYSNTVELGMVLYTKYVFPFEIAAVILLVAIIAAIVLTLRRRPNTRHQHPESQVSVQKKDRLRVVSMPSEERK